MAGNDTETLPTVEGPERPPQPVEGEPDDDIVLIKLLPEEREAHRERPSDRYRLKVRTFTGSEDVEQFIQMFSDVIDVTQWPPRVALLKLRMSLMEKGKPYGLGPDINSIFTALRARFGISAVDACAGYNG